MNSDPPSPPEPTAAHANSGAVSHHETSTQVPNNLTLTVHDSVTVKSPDPTPADQWKSLAGSALNLFIIPITLAALTFWFQRYSEQANQEIAANNRESETLNAYIDAVAMLLSGSDFEAATATQKASLIRAKSLTVLRQVNGERKGRMIRFLHEQGLVFTQDYLSQETEKVQAVAIAPIPQEPVPSDPVVSTNTDVTPVPEEPDKIRVALGGADLVDVDLGAAFLHDIDLSGAVIHNGNLQNTTLIRANLQGATLTGANLTDANLTGANLTQANLTEAVLTGAKYTDVTTASETCQILSLPFPCPTQFPENFDPVSAGLILQP